jgi:hypothetical protein
VLCGDGCHGDVSFVVKKFQIPNPNLTDLLSSPAPWKLIRVALVKAKVSMLDRFLIFLILPTTNAAQLTPLIRATSHI